MNICDSRLLHPSHTSHLLTTHPNRLYLDFLLSNRQTEQSTKKTESNLDSAILSWKSEARLTQGGKHSHAAKHRHWDVDNWNVNIVDGVQRVKSSDELKGERSPIKVHIYGYLCTWKGCLMEHLLCQLFVVMSTVEAVRDNCKLGSLNTSRWQLGCLRLILPIRRIITVNGGKRGTFLQPFNCLEIKRY